MGSCRFCGKDVGLFRSSHKECEEKHALGLVDLDSYIKGYFNGTMDLTSLRSYIMNLRVHAYVNKDDTIMLSCKAIRYYSDSLKFPSNQSQLTKVTDFMSAIKLNYQDLNKDGSLDYLAEKLLRGYIVSYFAVNNSLSNIRHNVQIVLSVFPLAADKVLNAYMNVLNQAADKFMAKGGVTSQEQQQIETYANAVGIQLNALPTRFHDSNLEKIIQLITINNLQKGILPVQNVAPTILLARGESIIWSYDNVAMYQEKIEKEYQGNRSGWSFRVMKGVNYHIGGTKLKPVEHSYMKEEGVGTLYVTNKHIVFQAQETAIKIPYSKIVGITPYSDGIDVHRDGTNAKRLVFQGFNSNFLINILSIINK